MASNQHLAHTALAIRQPQMGQQYLQCRLARHRQVRPGKWDSGVEHGAHRALGCLAQLGSHLICQHPQLPRLVPAQPARLDIQLHGGKQAPGQGTEGISYTAILLAGPK